jgi:hypothetical protein
LDNLDDSIYDSAFNLSDNLENTQKEDGYKKIFLNKKRGKSPFEKVNINATSDKVFSEYEEFINKNKIKVSSLKTIKFDNLDNRVISKNSGIFINTFESLKLSYKEDSDKLNENINMISKAYSFKGISFFSFEFLLDIHKQIKIINDSGTNLFEPKIKNNKIDIIANKFLQKNTFIIDIVGIYCYRKTNEYEDKNINGFKDIFLFHCRDSKYDRYLKNSINVNIGSLIAQSSNAIKGNCKIIKYLDINLEVKAGIVTSKNVKKGEILLLED